MIAADNQGKRNQNMLFGMLACHMGFITEESLDSHLDLLLADESLVLDRFLIDEGHIEAKDREMLMAMLKHYQSRDGGDVSQSIISMRPSPSLFSLMLNKMGNDFGEPSQDISTFAAFINLDDLTDTTEALTPGQADRFQIISHLESGGLGEIHIAKDSELNRRVALKRIQDWHADNQQSRERFLLEATVTGALEHPGIVPIYGLGADDKGRPFYAMRFIEGDSLKSEIRAFYAKTKSIKASTERSVAFRKMLNHFVDACNALAYAHSRGVLHRDVKPGNIMLGKYGETIVVDWGLVKILKSKSTASGNGEHLVKLGSSSSSMAPTMLGTAIGTPVYMSPEQAAGKVDSLDARSDVYSLGATLYTLLTGKTPFDQSNADVLTLVKAGEIAPIEKARGGIPRPLISICKKAMSRSRSGRYDTAIALGQDIERWLADEPVLAHRDSLVEWLNRSYRHYRTAITASLLILAASTALLWSSYRELESQYQAVEERSYRYAAVTADAMESNPSTQERLMVINKSVEAWNHLLDRFPNSDEYNFGAAKALIYRAHWERAMNELDQSTKTSHTALDHVDKAVRYGGNAETASQFRTKIHLGLFDVYDRSDLKKAKYHLEKANNAIRSIDLEDLDPTDPDDLELIRLSGKCYVRLSVFCFHENDLEGSLQHAKRAKKLFKDSWTQMRQDAEAQQLLFRSGERLARAQMLAGRPGDGLQGLEELLPELISNTETYNHPDLRHAATKALFRYADLRLQKSKSDAKGRELLDRAVNSWKILVKKHDRVFFYKMFAADSLIRRSSIVEAQQGLNDLMEAKSLLLKCIERDEKNVDVSFASKYVDCLWGLSQHSLVKEDQRERFRAEAQEKQEVLFKRYPLFKEHETRLQQIMNGQQPLPLFD